MPKALIFFQVPSSNLAGIRYEGPAGEDLLQRPEGKTFPEPQFGSWIPLVEVHPSAKQGTLYVAFKAPATSPDLIGNTYRYEGVSAETVKAMLAAESVGKFFNANIKGQEQYHGTKVDAFGVPEPREAQPPQAPKPKETPKP